MIELGRKAAGLFPSNCLVLDVWSVTNPIFVCSIRIATTKHFGLCVCVCAYCYINGKHMNERKTMLLTGLRCRREWLLPNLIPLKQVEEQNQRASVFSSSLLDSPIFLSIIYERMIQEQWIQEWTLDFFFETWSDFTRPESETIVFQWSSQL